MHGAPAGAQHYAPPPPRLSVHAIAPSGVPPFGQLGGPGGGGWGSALPYPQQAPPHAPTHEALSGPAPWHGALDAGAHGHHPLPLAQPPHAPRQGPSLYLRQQPFSYVAPPPALYTGAGGGGGGGGGALPGTAGGAASSQQNSLLTSLMVALGSANSTPNAPAAAGGPNVSAAGGPNSSALSPEALTSNFSTARHVSNPSGNPFRPGVDK